MESSIQLHPSDPAEFPPDWASDWGHDHFGYWAALTVFGIRYAFRWIRPGEFLMGSPENEPERRDNETLHRVTLTRGFWLGATTCTQALWERVTGQNPSEYKGENRPVESVSWEDCTAFLKQLNEMRANLDFRLPTEAEWEYACRAGTTTPFSFGETITTDQVNYNGDYPYAGGKKGQKRGETVDTGSLPPNPWGLYEMHGNVWEWCADGYGPYPDTHAVDPVGPADGDYRVLRGGSYLDSGRFVRSACRFRYVPGFRYDYTGFRLARGQRAAER